MLAQMQSVAGHGLNSLQNQVQNASHNSPVTTWTRCIMEQVWLCLLQGGQPISTITWFANENWPRRAQEGYDNIQRLDEQIDIMIWLAGELFCIDSTLLATFTTN